MIKRWFRRLIIENTALQGYFAHLPHGAFTAFAAIYLHWAIALIFTLGFVCFEVQQDWHLRDQGHNDIAGFLLGLVLASIAFYFIKAVA